MKILILISVIYCIEVADCTLISQSIIEECIKGDSSEPATGSGTTCGKKIVVSVTLRSGQAATDAIYANINTAYDLESRQNGILKKPYRIEIQKSEVIANYRVYYRGSANALPSEHIIMFSHEECSDDWFRADNTCGRYVDESGKEIFDSQGFCCRCSRSRKGFLPRASNASCEGHFFNKDQASVTGIDGERYEFRSSAHCMNVSDLWYDVFDVESPNLHYSINVSLLELKEIQSNLYPEEDEVEREPSYTWTALYNFTLQPDQPSGRTPDGKVIANIQGDLLGGHGLMDLSTKKLLIPSLRAWHHDYLPKEYINGPIDWLLIDEHFVDMSGQECNKVGLNFSGFRNQPGKCQQLPDSCFSNQPSMLWRADDLRRQHGIRGFYMLHNYGTIHSSTQPNNSSFIMRLMYPDLHNSLVTFHIDATDVSFVVNVGKGRIVSAESRGFNRSTLSTGEVIIVVENLSDLSQDFNLVLTECFGREDLPSKRVPVYPGQTATVSFPLFSRNIKHITTECEVQLFDQRFVLLGTARLTFSVDAPCFCFGVCDCVCDTTTGRVTEKACPTPAPIYINVKSTGTKVLLYVLNFIGLHGIVGFFGTFLLCLGMVKLIFGGVIFCRKSKAQEHYDELRKKGVPRKSPKLVKCSGFCSGALAAKAKMKRKALRFKKLGKDPNNLDDWTNMSFTCYCNAELSDIRFMNVIKAMCFFYYLLILPCIWLGKKIWWGCFVDTVGKKKAAESAVLKSVRRKGPEEMEKLGVVSLRDVVKSYQDQRDTQKKLKKEAQKDKKGQAILEVYKRKKKRGEIPERLQTYTQSAKNNEKLLAEAEKDKVEAIMKAYERKKKQSKPDKALEDLEFLDEDLWAVGGPDGDILAELPDALSPDVSNPANSNPDSVSLDPNTDSFTSLSARDTFFSIDLTRPRRSTAGQNAIGDSEQLQGPGPDNYFF